MRADEALRREAEMDRLIVGAYKRHPQTAEELAFAELATRTMLGSAGPWESGGS